MKKFLVGILAVCFIVCVGAISVEATLVDQGIHTFDDETGFRWLDLTETTGLSRNDVLSSSWMDNYRYATDAEFLELIANAGHDGSGEVDGSYYSYYGTNVPNTYPAHIPVVSNFEEELDNARILQSLLGVNSSVNWNENEVGNWSYGFTEIGQAHILSSPDLIHYYNGSPSVGSANVSYGSFLIETGSLNTAPVPEPCTMLLLGTGLAGMGIWKRKKTKK